MRTRMFAEGHGIVEVHRGRAHMHLDGHYIGRATRMATGMWRDLARPHLSFAGPVEAAEDMAENLAAAR